MRGCWFRVSFPCIARVEGNGLVSSLSQELGVWYIAQEGGMKPKITQRNEVNFWIEFALVTAEGI